jgi:signal transduction histidine kinase
MEQMLSQHDAIVKMIHDMVMENTNLWTDTDEQMALDISDLADDSSLLLIACFLLAIIFAASTVVVVRKGIQRIEWQRDELNRVSWHMLQTQEDTARRFSHEMHDELGQSLAAVRANLAEHNWVHEERRRESMHLVDEAIANVRELSQLLRPVILDDFGLEAALRSLVERFGQRTRIDMIFTCNFSGRIESTTETHLYRIAQEALTNIARHSRATSVEISLMEEAKQIFLTIQDNGIGMPSTHEETSSSLGLIGMRARARECGGTLTHQTIAPQGVKVTVTVPFDPALPNE